MSIYFIPALVGLVLKLFILAHSIGAEKTSKAFIYLVLIFAGHNLIELIGYLRFLDDQVVSTLFRAYYVATAFMLMSLPLHALSISNMNFKGSLPWMLLAATILSILIMLTDVVVAGSYSIGYAMTAVKGGGYWLFSVFAVLALLGNAAILIYGYRKAKNQLAANRCLYSLLALSPLIIFCLLVVIMKALDVNINAAGLIPLATTFFLITMVKNESKHRLMDVRRLLPFSMERKSAANYICLMDNFAQNNNEPDSYLKLRKGIEKEVINYVLKKNNRNVTKAAKMMGLPNRSTLYSMMRRLDIDLGDDSGA